MRNEFNAGSAREADDRARTMAHRTGVTMASLAATNTLTVSTGLSLFLVQNSLLAVGIGLGAGVPLACVAAVGAYWATNRMLAPHSANPAP